MKQDSLAFVMMIIISGPLAVAIFIFLGQIILNFLKIPDKSVSRSRKVPIIETKRVGGIKNNFA